MNDAKWDKKLNIITGAADFEKEDQNHSRYEATSYAVLARLAESGFLKKENVLVDYGCGKGRVGFYLNYALGMKTIGVEYSETLFMQAQQNLNSYAGRRDSGVSFVCRSAESYDPDSADCFYFFNPFSVKILQGVLARIYESYYAAPRPMQLFFYYALDGYLSCLMAENGMEYAGEIDCSDLFYNPDPKEKILVFSFNPLQA